jgi:hypothetical protein
MIGYRNRKVRMNTRLLCAVTFLLFLFVQTGTHLSLDLHEHFGSAELPHALHFETEHDDEACELESACGEDCRDDDQSPNLQDENNHHLALLSETLIKFFRDSEASRSAAFGSQSNPSRSLRPLYLPPKHS